MYTAFEILDGLWDLSINVCDLVFSAYTLACYLHTHTYRHTYTLTYYIYIYRGFPGGSEVKASACNAGDLSSIPGLGRSPGEGNGNPLSSILAWRIPWTEEPGGLQSTGSQRVGHD